MPSKQPRTDEKYRVIWSVRKPYRHKDITRRVTRQLYEEDVFLENLKKELGDTFMYETTSLLLLPFHVFTVCV